MSKRMTISLIRNRIRQLNDRIDIMIVGGKADKPQCREMMKEHKTLFYQLQNLNMKTIKIIQTVHDADCPKCGFPETVQLRNEKTGKILGESCSKRDCPKRYFVLYK